MAGGLSELFELLPPPGRLSLDLACGTGELARELRARGYEVLAVERSRERVREARKADRRMEVLRADVTRMPMARASPTSPSRRASRASWTRSARSRGC